MRLTLFALIASSLAGCGRTPCLAPTPIVHPTGAQIQESENSKTDDPPFVPWWAEVE